MPSRTSLGKGFLGALVLTVAILAVGLTASSDSAFSITLRPVFVFFQLGLDVDVKIGAMHLHTHWSLFPSSTKPADSGF